MRPIPHPHLRHLGVSLIEALVALAVMSFGMLALIGVQSTMRINTDLSRQTTEAARIATEDLESLRLFVDVRHDDDQPVPSWDDLTNRTATVQLPGDTGNVSFALSRQLTNFPTRPEQMTRLGLVASQAKIAQTTVTWTDRTNSTRTVRLQGLVSATSPALAGILSLPPISGVTARSNNRHPSIPVSARDLGNGKSAYKPSTTSNVVWVFNNTTGAITGRCSSVALAQADITADSVSSCTAVGYGSLVSGTVRFHLTAPPSGGYTAAQAEDPQGAAGTETLALGSTPLSFNANNRVGLVSPFSECFAGLLYTPSGSTARGPSAIDYTCLVYATDANGWGGRIDLSVAVPGWAPTSLSTADSTAQRLRVCRYTRSSSDYTANRDHPRTYCRVASDECLSANRVTRNLNNQNFLVIAAGGLCPADSDNNAASGQDPLRNANTLAHQP
ncbi:hypothetical protein AACH10_00950 [Ideonella sp. DXS22W]|uniref:Prepilin-type N-terminal cleavage/methylation domain-containing protein n=1 Tax=Pseudaquabacterium inlustre TaxID=2984192 RepID=A0ABU9CAW1_9BURK